ncbi:uncharacterized protein LOC126796004 [Argentina anserina]|uniref:uncharacterized protein LOC126796004 n=1 Tax=Argentina anserina TaxID=57926 RepID=UPI0021762EE2|nr:uncharacterized protein LOC126796004 [Potentilla anserina]XP_050378700.1 uncharacterized protein LOC126796004 [Potentilla anserina]
MRLEMEFEKNCRVGLSPNTVLPTHRHSCVEKRSTKGRPPRRDDLLSIKEGFVEISFQRYRSTSCKAPSRPVGQEGNIDYKRGSIYQSSKEVKEIKKMGTAEGRKKIEKSFSSGSSFSDRIVDTSRSSGEESQHIRASVLSLKPELNVPSPGRPHVESCSLDSILEICVDPDDREEQSAEALGEDPMHLNLRSDPVGGPSNNGNELLERDEVHKLHKSFSAKVEMLHTPSPSESDRSSSVSSKTRFNNIRKVFDPFKKSKSLRSPSYVVDPGGAKTTGMADVTKGRMHQKSLLPVFSNMVQNAGCDPLRINQDYHQSSVASSPVHLHGHIKLLNKHGMPFFEFSLKGSGDVFVARTWKADNGFNWVYTFHAIGGRKKSNASSVGLHGSDRDSSMVGQMQVSCYLCSELKDGAFDNSMLTEFVLYDISHARQIAAENAHSSCTLDDAKHPKGSNQSMEGATLKLEDGSCPMKVKPQHKGSDSNSSAWPFAALHPGLEIAAIVMQVPFEKRENLKYKRGDKVCDKVPANLLKLSTVKQKKEDPDSWNSGNLKVIIPSGNHGLPSAESKGPSSLLDRWRYVGGCDCGGWDMFCPLTVLSNPNIQLADNQLFEDNQQPLELFVQGSKEKKPALTMTMVEDGQYAVDFHAQLSTLQAFSMCVSILHGTETSASVTGQEENKQLSQNNSLKVLKEEVKFLIEAVTEGEKKIVAKRVKKIQPACMLDPPFSPIARV